MPRSKDGYRIPPYKLRNPSAKHLRRNIRKMVMKWRSEWKGELLRGQLEVDTWIERLGDTGQSWEEANDFFNLWLAARGYSFETRFDVPWSFLWTDENPFSLAC